jgi:CRP-like cAMP-binding protein
MGFAENPHKDQCCSTAMHSQSGGLCMSAPASHNRLLALLPEEDHQYLMTQAETISVQHLVELYPALGAIDSVYFPLTLVASILLRVDHGREVEIATIGNEGMLGISAVLDVPQAFGRTLVQVTGTALRLNIRALRAHMERQPLLRTMLARYLHALVRQIMQAGACNLLHSVEERCARWLLMMHDRVHRDAFVLTQQFLAEMMGVRRATVNFILGDFKQAGLIAHTRGHIQILDRAALEAVSCPCYATIAAEFQRLQTDIHSP